MFPFPDQAPWGSSAKLSALAGALTSTVLMLSSLLAMLGEFA